MSQSLGFAEILDAAEQLDADTQAELMAILSRRLAEARRQFAEGLCEPTSAEDLIRQA